jgi:hypothetical protein
LSVRWSSLKYAGERRKTVSFPERRFRQFRLPLLFLCICSAPINPVALP